MSKKVIAILFGGQSSEHEVSCSSATTIIHNINKEKYDVVIIGITKEGKWLLVDSVEAIVKDTWKNSFVTAIISPDASQKGIFILDHDKTRLQKIDVIFPVLHGKYGEDGTVQGLMELSGIPYVGCGVLSSAVAMDKLFTKIIVDTLHIRQAKYMAVRKTELRDLENVCDKIEETLKYPVFIKPCNAGSSRGISKAQNRLELEQGLLLASEHDIKILVEEMVVGRELECAVLASLEPKAFGIGEIISGAEFYDYDAKYHSEKSKTIISPELENGKTEEIQMKSIQIFKALDCRGLARIDYFLEKDTNEVVFNEINTLPGFTSISMYPVLWEEQGINKEELVERLIESAFISEK